MDSCRALDSAGIVIEGTSFWGALKRADRIAQGNLLTIGVGEVGVDVICRITTGLVYLMGVGCFAGVMYLQSQRIIIALPLIGMAALSWTGLVVVVTAGFNIYSSCFLHLPLCLGNRSGSRRRSTSPPRVGSSSAGRCTSLTASQPSPQSKVGFSPGRMLLPLIARE